MNAKTHKTNAPATPTPHRLDDGLVASKSSEDRLVASQLSENGPLASKRSQEEPVAPKLGEGGRLRRRTGKIARLPQDLRELLNLMLRDGAPYSLIIRKFAERGHKLNPDNLSRWHAGGYQDWLQDQAWLEEMRVRLDFATDIVHQRNGALLDAASLRIAVTQMYSLLTDFNPVILKNQLANHPGAYSRILNALCKLTESGIKCERHRLSHPLNRSILPAPSSVPAPSSSPHPSSSILHPLSSPPR